MTSTALYLGACHASIALCENYSFALKDLIIVESYEYKESTVFDTHHEVCFFDEPNPSYISTPWPVFDQTLICPSVIEDALDDKMLTLLWERCPLRFRFKYSNSVSRYNKQLQILFSALSWLSKNKINAVVFSYEPHNLWIYLLKKAALAYNCKVLTLTNSPLPWRYFLSCQ